MRKREESGEAMAEDSQAPVIEEAALPDAALPPEPAAESVEASGEEFSTEEEPAVENREALPPLEGDPLYSLRYTLTRREIYDILMRTSRRPGTVRMIVYTVLLVLLAVYCFVGYALSGGTDLSPEKDGTSLRIGIAALVILAIAWVVPYLFFWYESGSLFKDIKEVKLDIYGDRFVFAGETAGQFPLDVYRPEKPGKDDGGMLLLQLGSDTAGIPRRAMEGGDWDDLRAMLETAVCEPPEPDNNGEDADEH